MFNLNTWTFSGFVNVFNTQKTKSFETSSQSGPPSSVKVVSVFRIEATLKVLPLVVVPDPLVGDPLGPHEDWAATVGTQPVDIATWGQV